MCGKAACGVKEQCEKMGASRTWSNSSDIDPKLMSYDVMEHREENKKKILHDTKEGNIKKVRQMKHKK